MSPRSQEFYDRARERLAGARRIFDQGEYAIAVGAAYYAMLYGARAALSERHLHARTGFSLTFGSRRVRDELLGDRQR